MSAIYGLIICKAVSNPLQDWLCEVGGYLTSTTSYPGTATTPVIPWTEEPVGYIPWVCRESDMTEATDNHHMH